MSRFASTSCMYIHICMGLDISIYTINIIVKTKKAWTIHALNEKSIIIQTNGYVYVSYPKWFLRKIKVWLKFLAIHIACDSVSMCMTMTIKIYIITLL